MVDTRSNCGNMLSGAAPFAIDEAAYRRDASTVRVHNVNRRVIEAVVQTGGHLTAKAMHDDGVPGTAAPVVELLRLGRHHGASCFTARQEYVDG